VVDEPVATAEPAAEELEAPGQATAAADAATAVQPGPAVGASARLTEGADPDASSQPGPAAPQTERIIGAEPDVAVVPTPPSTTDTSASGSSNDDDLMPVAPALSSELAPTPAELIAEAAEAAPPFRPEPTPSGSRPTPSQPTSSGKPTPSQPTPSQPTPSQPASSQPIPSEPAPVDASAAEAMPSDQQERFPGDLEPETIRGSQSLAPPTSGDTGLVAAEGERAEPWAKLIADPGHAPELLALAAVQSIGPSAREWLERTKRDYPTADHAALARLATNQFTRAGSLGSVVGAVAGSYAPIVLLGTAAFAHAELILHVAAAYGLDPLDPERAVDLLVLTRVHPDRAGAEEALAAARQPAYDEAGGLTAAVWRLSRMISTRIGGWGVVRLINRYLPGVGLLTAFLTSRAAAESVAARANAHYRETTSR
jgi:hypothetical protein